jgi:hypothetical protein
MDPQIGDRLGEANNVLLIAASDSHTATSEDSAPAGSGDVEEGGSRDAEGAGSRDGEKGGSRNAEGAGSRDGEEIGSEDSATGASADSAAGAEDSVAATSDGVCRALLNRGDSEPSGVVSAIFTRSVAERAQFVGNSFGDDVDTAITVIPVGERRSAKVGTEDDGHGEEGLDVGVDIRPVADPTNTLALGVELVGCLSRLSAEGYRVTGCVYTLSDLLSEVGYERTRELLEPVLERTAELGASVHYHLDREAQDDVVVDLLRPLFDAVVEVGPDGEREVVHEESAPDRAVALKRESTVTPGEATPSHDTILSLLSDSRRRELLYYLRTFEPGSTVPVDSLVDRLIQVERGETSGADRRQRIAIDLQHRCLPRLADAGVIDYHDSSEIVRNTWETPMDAWIEQALRLDRKFDASDADSGDDTESGL